MPEDVQKDNAAEINLSLFRRDRFFLFLALTETRGAIDHLEQAKIRARARHPRDGGVVVFENVTIFDSIRLALHITAGISRIFWPSRNQDRGKRLRALTGLSLDHPLANRRLRDHIEHLDERLDHLLDTENSTFFVAWLALMPGESRENLKGVAEKTFATFNRDSETLSLLGEDYSINELQRALQDVLERTSNALS